MNYQQVVDVTVNIEGKPTIYVVPDNVAITYSGNIVISCDKDCILNEVKSMKGQAEQILASVDEMQDRLKKM